jgi:hypothetical protein
MKYTIDFYGSDNGIRSINAESLDELLKILFRDYKDITNDSVTCHDEFTLYKTPSNEVYVRYTEDRYMGYYYLDIENSGTRFNTYADMESEHTKISIHDLTFEQFIVFFKCACSATDEYATPLIVINDETTNDIYHLSDRWLHTLNFEKPNDINLSDDTWINSYLVK